MGEASFFKNPPLIDSNSTCYLVIGERDVRFESLPTQRVIQEMLAMVPLAAMSEASIRKKLNSFEQRSCNQSIVRVCKTLKDL